MTSTATRRGFLLATPSIITAGCGGTVDDAPVSSLPVALAATTEVPVVAVASAPIIQEHRLHCVLRPGSDGIWFIQDDDDHMPMGFIPYVEHGPDFVIVRFTRNYDRAGVIQITSDDDFGDVITGHSNLGLGGAQIRISANGKRINPRSIWDYLPGATGGNFWISVTMIDKR